jgi:hypothetical protein
LPFAFSFSAFSLRVSISRADSSSIKLRMSATYGSTEVPL